MTPYFLRSLGQLACNGCLAKRIYQRHRLMKTLLLSALVPEGRLFQTTHRQSAGRAESRYHQNADSGAGATNGDAKCRKWAGRVGEIKISDDSTIPPLRYSFGCGYREHSWSRPDSWDSGRRSRKLVKDLVFDTFFGVSDDNQLFIEHRWIYGEVRAVQWK